MTRETILVIIGILIALSPWSGLPLAWLSYGLVLFGLAVTGIGVTLRGRQQAAIEMLREQPATPKEISTVPATPIVPEASTIPPQPAPESLISPPSQRTRRIAKF